MLQKNQKNQDVKLIYSSINCKPLKVKHKNVN